jgi:hypothetical protein
MATSTDTLVRLEDGQIKTIGGDNISVAGNLTTAGELDANTLAITTNASIGGDLQVLGSVISTGAEHILTSDSVFEMNAGYTNTGTDSVAGYAATIKATTGGGTGTALTGAVFTAGVAGGGAGASDAKFHLVGAKFDTAYKKGDIIQISGCETAAGNNGIYVVAADPGGVNDDPVFVCGIQTALPANTVWAHSDFDAATEAGTGANFCRGDFAVSLISNGVIHDSSAAVIPTGSFCTAYAVSAGVVVGGTPLALNRNALDFSLVEASVDLEDAYTLGGTITTTAGKPIAFTLLQDGAGFSVDGTAAGGGEVSIGGTTAVDSIVMAGNGTASSWSSTGANLSLSTVTSGTLALTSIGTLDLDGVVFQMDGTDTSHIKVTTSDDGNKALDIEVVNSGSGKAQLNLDADDVVAVTTGAYDLNASGPITMDGGAASNLSVAGLNTNLTVEATGAGTSQVIASSAGTGGNAIHINASAGGIDVDALLGFQVNSGTSSGITVAANSGVASDLTFSTANGGAGVGTLNMDGDAVTLNSGTAACDIVGAVNASLTATTGTLSVVSTAGALTQTAALSSTWSMAANNANPHKLTIEASNADVGALNVGHLELLTDGDLTAEATTGAVLLKTGHLGAETATQFLQRRVMMLKGASTVTYANNTTIAGNDVVGIMASNAGGAAGDPCLMFMQPGTLAEITMQVGVPCAIGDRLYLDIDGMCVTQSTTVSGSTVVLVGIAVDAIGAGANGLCVFSGRAIAEIP